MKELEKTKSISIAAVLSILVVLIAVISFKRPKHLYDSSTAEALAQITSTDYLINQSDVDLDNQALIDIRNRFDYDRGHMEQAINIHTPELLDKEHKDVLKGLINDGKTLVLYGNTPSEAVTPFMMLTQLGFDDVKILSVANSYYQNNLVTDAATVEKPIGDASAFIQESINKTNAIMAKAGDDANASTIVKPKTTSPKTVVPEKKKKKRPVEGGC